MGTIEVTENGAGGYSLVERQRGWVRATGSGGYSHYRNAEIAALRCNGRIDTARKSRAEWRAFYRIEAGRVGGAQ